MSSDLLSSSAVFQDETVTIETVVPFEVSVKFVSTKVCMMLSDKAAFILFSVLLQVDFTVLVQTAACFYIQGSYRVQKFGN